MHLYHQPSGQWCTGWEEYFITLLALLRHQELPTALLMDLWVESVTLCAAFLPGTEQLAKHSQWWSSRRPTTASAKFDFPENLVSVGLFYLFIYFCYHRLCVGRPKEILPDVGSQEFKDLKEEALLMLSPLMYSSATLVGNLLGFTGVENLVNLVFMDIHANSV